MDSLFDPQTIEPRVSERWERARLFEVQAIDKTAEPYSIVIPPPNVTGSLHMGHALNTTLQDILCRFERMRGKQVLWQPGTDHAGIATQMVVERQLRERQQPDRRSLGREAFVERVWQWKAESGNQIIHQLKRLGASCDWSRERFTLDEGLSRAVTKVFVHLYREGLIYKDKRLVNWDPKFQTAISDLEVVPTETKGSLWFFHYPLLDQNKQEMGQTICVATTRPETLLGDCAVAIHPEDPRYQTLHGAWVRLPLTGRLIPLICDSYSDPEKGSGAVKITPAHDFNDFEVGKRHHLPLINIFDAEGRLYLLKNTSFLDSSSQASLEEKALWAQLEGQDRFAARTMIVTAMEKQGLIEKIEPHVHMVPHGDRSGVVIEPFLTDQWYVDAAKLAQPALEAVRQNHIRFSPAHWDKTYYAWLENIQPWCISRQLWWGHQIPAWTTPWGEIFVAETESEAWAQAFQKARVLNFWSEAEITALQHDPERLRHVIKRDEDVLDTWFSSALWPFSTLGWPEVTPELQRFYPTSVLVTGFDIIFFWVARMIMMGLHFMKEVPFQNIYIHALVRDATGAKMSKSKGNVIDPLSLMDQYGADALRLALTLMAIQGRDIKLAPARVENARNFATKLWNSWRFAKMNGCHLTPHFDPRQVILPLNQWILSRLAYTAQNVTDYLIAYRFSEAAQTITRFIWNVFCDWYLELSKPFLQSEISSEKQEIQATTAFVLENCLALLHPFMPFLTEELWAFHREEKDSSSALPAFLTHVPWPKLEALRQPQAEEEIEWLRELVSEIRSVRNEMNVPAAAFLSLVVITPSPSLIERLHQAKAPLERLARINEIRFETHLPPHSMRRVIGETIYALPLSDVVNMEKEHARLRKELTHLESEISKIETRLSNPKFLAGAQKEALEDNQERLGEAHQRLSKIKETLQYL